KNATATPDENKVGRQQPFRLYWIFPEGEVTDARPLRGLGVAAGRQRCGDQERLSQARQEASPRFEQERSEGRGALCRDQFGQRDRGGRGKAQAVRPR